MKKTWIVVAIVISILSSAFGQNCTPDAAIILTSFKGMYPDPAVNPNLPTGVVNGLYSTTITFKIGADTTIDLSSWIGFPFPPVTCTINYYEIIQPVTLPAGLTTNCEPVICQIAGGTNGCMTIEGTPTTAGVSAISVPGSYTIAIPNAVPVIGGTTQTIPATYQPYSLTIVSGAGIETNSNNTYVKFYPNPAADQFNIQCNDDMIEIKIMSLAGSVIKRMGKTNSINVADMANGIYVIEVITAKGSSRQKLIIQK